MRYLYVSGLVFMFIACVALLSGASTAIADCANPTKPEGYVLYNADYKTMQFCDGTTWWTMKGGGGLPVCTAGDSIVYSGSSWVCSSSFFNPFSGGNQTADSVLEFARYLADYDDSGGVQAGGSLTINGGALGSYDFVIKEGDQTISSFNSVDWFTTTADSHSAFVVVKGDLAIDSGQTFRPDARKLFTVVYVTGNLTVNGEISMSQRGANHSATGSSITASAIRIATGTFSSVTNPQVPAAGANGGTSVSRSTNGVTAGNGGSTGTAGATGGGGSGAASRSDSGTAVSGGGATGTGFSGGSGGGAARSFASGTHTAQSGASNGGKGGDAISASSAVGAGGGAGNPGGARAGSGSEGQPGDDGTGGILFVIVEGNYSGSGAVVAAGAAGGNVAPSQSLRVGGGGSGGGSVTMMIGGTDSGPTPTALGGAGGVSDANGGNGGNGTARKLAL